MEITNKPLTVDEAAEFLGFTTSYLYKLIHKKLIPHYKPLGGRVFFKKEELEKFIYRNRCSTSQELEELANQRILRRKLP